jgi:hypothetical protein
MAASFVGAQARCALHRWPSRFLAPGHFASIAAIATSSAAC